MVKLVKYIGVACALCFIAVFTLASMAIFTLKTDQAQMFIQNQINANITGSVTWERFRFSLIKGSFEVTNGILNGPAGEDLARFDHLSITILWRALREGNIALSSVVIEKPRVIINIEKDGSLNLAKIFTAAKADEKKIEVPPSESNTAGLPFNVVIKCLKIKEGSVLYSTAENNFQTEIDDVTLSANADLVGESGGLALKIGNGSISTPAATAGFDNLELKIRLENRMVTLDTFQGNIAAGNFEMQGQIDFRKAFPEGFFHSTPALDATTYTVSFQEKGIDVGKILKDSDVKGLVSSSFSLEGTGLSPQTLLARLKAELSAEQVAVGIRAIPTDMKASITTNLNKGLATVERFDARAGEITASAGGAFDLSSRAIAAHLELDAPNLSGTLSSLGLEGTGGGTHLIGTLSGTVTRPVFECSMEGSRLRYKDFMVGDIRTTVELDQSGILRVQELTIDNRNSVLRVSGTVQLLKDSAFIKNPSFQLDLFSTGIYLEDFIDDAKGKVLLRGHLEGTPEKPELDCDLQTENLHLRDFGIGDIQAKAVLDRSGLLRLQKFTLHNGNSALAASGMVQLFDNTTFLTDPPFQLDFQSKSTLLNDFTALAKGKISFAGHCEGTPGSPKGTIEIRGNGMDFGVQKLSGFRLSAKLDGKKLHVTPLKVDIAPGEVIEGSGWLSLDKAYQFNLVSKGISLRSIDKLKDQKTAEGTIVFNLSGEGVLDNPSLSGTVMLHDIQIEGRKFEDLEVNLDVRNGLAKAFGRLNFDFDGAYHLTQKDFQVSADFKESNLKPYFELAGRKDFKGIATGTLKVKGNAASLNRIEASADFQEFTLYFKDLRILHTESFEAIYGNNEFTIAPCHFELLKDGHLEIEGNGKPDGPISLRIDGKLPLRIAQPFVEDISDMTGNLLLSARVEGTQAAPDIRAHLTLEEIGLTVPVLLQKLHSVNGLIEVTPKTVTIKDIKGNLDSGNFDMNGTIDIKDFKPRQVDITVTASALPLRIPDMMDSLLNAKLEISGNPEQSKAQGEVVLLEGTYYKDVDLNLIQLVKERKREVAPPPREITYPFVKNMELDVSVKRRNPFVIDNNLAQLEVSPDLVFAGTINNPLIKGRAEVNSGTVTYYKKTFDVKRGIIDFLNPYKIEPTIDIAGEAQIKKWRIFLNISGTPDQIAFNLTSEPPEEAGDIVSLLLLGKTTREFSELGGGATRSTKELLAEMIATTFGEDIKKTTGLDILEVETGSLKEETATESIKVTLGKQLTKRMTVKYAAETKDGEMIQRAIAEYQFLENILLNGFQDSKGVFGGELLFRLEFR
ncbi:MAG: translocation/assembly module TamB domain-containing protein [Syntrophales bacterium]|nr:translocation/assembly module TamB domain-containing protein [Syntrophales bacterium]